MMIERGTKIAEEREDPPFDLDGAAAERTRGFWAAESLTPTEKEDKRREAAFKRMKERQASRSITRERGGREGGRRRKEPQSEEGKRRREGKGSSNE